MRALFLSLFLMISIAGLGQSYGKNRLSDRIYFGGGMGFNFGSTLTTVSASPQVGYKITERFSAGVGVIYQYTDYKLLDVTLNHYGGSIFTRYIVFQNFFATIEYEYMTIEFPTNQSFSETSREGYSSLFAGGGYVQPISRNVSFSVIGLYNLLYDPAGNSPYDSPFVFRAGINVGF